MGYQTTFEGHFSLDRKLEPQHAAYLRAFNGTRRMRRDASLAEKFSDPVRVAAGLPVGVDGGYYVGSTKDHGQRHDSSILDYSGPPAGQPELWCKWEPTPDDTGIQWDGVEKFYDYVERLEYLIVHFLEPWGYRISGEVTWDGEEHGDFGTIRIVDGRPVRMSPTWGTQLSKG